MRIEKLETGYRLSDMYITAAILCQDDMEFVSDEAILSKDSNKNQTMFAVKGNPEAIKKIIDDFFNGKLVVNARLYKDKVQFLKSRIYANY